MNHCWRRLGIIVGLALPLAAADGRPLAEAARLSFDDPAMAELVTAWQDRHAELVAQLDADDRLARRGAARVLLAGSPAIGELIGWIVGCPRADLRHLLAQGLLDRSDDWRPAQLLPVPDPDLVCLLWSQHPAEALADTTIAEQVRTWLSDPTTVDAAAALVCARGSVADWGEPLCAAITDEADETVVHRCHAALGLLTGEQRSIAPYAGHYDLLAQDWRDRLASLGSQGAAVDPELLAAIGDLPDQDARRRLQLAGRDALPAFEQALAASSGAERDRIQALARLCARDVPAYLSERLGEETFADLDHPEARQRLALFRRLAEEVAETPGKYGLRHLLTWLDDDAAEVRAAVLDRLVRLSDLEDSFQGGEWKLGSLFDQDRTVHRLRRSLREGSPDERVGALLLIGSLRAGVFTEDVLALTLAADRAVVDTALDTLPRLDVSDHLEPLLRLAKDPQQPTLRRVRVIELCASAARRFSATDARRSKLSNALSELAADSDAAVAKAAKKARIDSIGRNEDSAEIIAELIADPEMRGLALDYIASQPFVSSYHRRQKPKLQDPAEHAVALLTDPEWGERAATTLATALADNSPSESDHTRQTIDAGLRAEILARAQDTGRAERAGYLRLAIQLDLIDNETATTLIQALPEGAARPAWADLVLAEQRPLIALRLAQAHLGEADADTFATLVDRLLTAVLIAEGVLEDLLAAGRVQAIRYQDSDSDWGDEARITTYTLHDGTTLKLRGELSQEARQQNRYGDEHMDWTLVEAPAHRIAAEQLPEIAEAMQAMPLDGGRPAALRDLAVAIATGTAPDPALAEDTLRYHSDLWLFLLHRHPELRPAITKRLNADESVRYWTLRPFAEDGNPDLIPAMLTALGQTRPDDRDITEILTWLGTLPPADLQPHIAALLDIDQARNAPGLMPLLEGLERLPLSLTLDILAKGKPISVSEIQLGSEAETRTQLAEGLPRLSASVVLGQAPTLRQLRQAAPEAFDAALPALLQSDDDRCAAWLRSAIPLQAGLEERYRQARQSSHDAVWLAGEAWALQAGEQDAGSFIDRLASRDPTAFSDGARIVDRYADSESLRGHEPAVATILATVPDAGLGTWLALLPPDPAHWRPVADRLAEDDRILLLVVLALDTHRRAAPDTWRPVIEAVAEQSGRDLSFAAGPGPASEAGQGAD